MFSGVIIWRNGRKLLCIRNNKNANRQIYAKFSGLANGKPYPDVACRCRDGSAACSSLGHSYPGKSGMYGSEGCAL
jgi:hypothetical protein